MINICFIASDQQISEQITTFWLNSCKIIIILRLRLESFVFTKVIIKEIIYLIYLNDLKSQVSKSHFNLIS